MVKNYIYIWCICKGLAYKIYKDLLKMKTLKTSNPIKNEKKIEQTFHFTKQIHREQIPCVEREDAKMLNIISYQRHTKLKP